MPKKKEFKDLSMEELEEIFYGPNMNGENVDATRLRRYENHMIVNITSPHQEEIVETLLSNVGEVTKIPESDIHTFDYAVHDVKLLTEVTGINCIFTLGINKIDTYTKIREAVNHIVEKSSEEFPDYIRGGIIFYDALFWWFGHMAEHLNKELPSKFEFEVWDWDYLIFYPPQISQKISITVYLKNHEVRGLIEEILNGKDVNFF